MDHLADRRLKRGLQNVDLSRPTMLITDDDGAFRQTLQSAFSPRGFRTLLASDGDEALDILRRERVHLLLTDMHMPRMNGLEIIQQIRPCRLILPWILISARVDDQLVRKARDLHAFSVLRKPVRFPEVVGAVREAMRVTYGWTGEDSESGSRA
jgi:CheY-like chemotaxis protein